MQILILLFFIGIVSSLLFEQVPSLISISAIFISAVMLALYKHRLFKYMGIIGLGCFWALTNAYLINNSVLPNNLENLPIIVEGFISSIPVQQKTQSSFEFTVANLQGRTWHGKVMLYYPHNPKIQVGQTWRLLVKLRRPHSLSNPACIDTEKFYFKNHIRAIGTVLPSQRNQFVITAKNHCIVQRMRERLLQKIMQQCPQSDKSAIIVALVLGMTHLITPTQWQVFRNTGTNHLIAISGLHIGLVAAVVFKATWYVWVRIPNGPLIVPTPYVSAAVSLLAATSYSMLAGLSSSIQRSLIMVVFFTLSIFAKRQITTAQSCCYALGVIIFLQPFAILSLGFWLSFCALFLLIYGMQGRFSLSGLWWRWGRAQWVVTVGMLPTIILLFKQITLISLPANIVAVPWFSFFVIPCCLFGALMAVISHNLSSFFFQLANCFLQWIWFFLIKLVDYLPQLIWPQAFTNFWNIIFAHLAAYVYLAPSILAMRFLSFYLALPCIFIPTAFPNALQMTVLDVGQGLSILLSTRHHALLFDTGAKINDHYDMGKAVIIPYLLQLGIKKLDVLTISHGDNDHIGGSNSLLRTIPVTRIITSVPNRFEHRLQPIVCKENLGWQWEGVTFKFLSPPSDAGFTGNNASCVLKATIGNQSILLTGDIEKLAEKTLITRHEKELPATVLVAGHHGSKTSSTESFLNAVSPRFVIFSCGYLNSYHHPHPEVIKRCLKHKCQLLSTVISGAITMTLFGDSDKVIVQSYRKKYHKIWH